MNNLYILTHLLLKYRLGLDTVYRLGLVCRNTRAYLQILKKIQHHRKSNRQCYKKIMRQLCKKNKLIDIYNNGGTRESLYWRGRYRVEYKHWDNKLLAERYITKSGKTVDVSQVVNIFEYNNYIAIETFDCDNNTILKNMAHSDDDHAYMHDNYIDTCKSCILYRVLQYRFHI